MWVPLIALGLVIVVATHKSKRRVSKGDSSPSGPWGLRTIRWPLRTAHPRDREVAREGDGNQSRRFGATRSGGGRRHAGIDLYAYAGDDVLAIADGVIVAVQSFHLGSWAVLVDHGPFVALYGEVTKNSWRDLGLEVGSTVTAGQTIARVACMRRDETGRCRSHMLHFELYKRGTARNARWYGGAPPENLLNPTDLLVWAARLKGVG